MRHTCKHSHLPRTLTHTTHTLNTHAQHRMSLPVNPLPATSLGAPMLDTTSDLPLTRGNYGAIGPPPRKHGVPSSYGGRMSPTRKLSHGKPLLFSLQINFITIVFFSAGLHFRQFPTPLEHLGKNDPIPGPTSVPPTFTPPPSAPHSKLEAPWLTPNKENSPTRNRSVSWAGQHVSM